MRTQIRTAAIVTSAALATSFVAPISAHAAPIAAADWVESTGQWDVAKFGNGELELNGSVFSADSPSTSDASIQATFTLHDNYPTDPWAPGMGVWFRTSGGGTTGFTGLRWQLDKPMTNHFTGGEYNLTYFENGAWTCRFAWQPIPDSYDNLATHRVMLTSRGPGVVVELDGSEVYRIDDLAAAMSPPSWKTGGGCDGKAVPTGTQIGLSEWNGGTYGVFGDVTVTDLAAPTNVAPLVSQAAQDVTVDEGGTATVSGSFTDADGDALSLTSDAAAGFADNADGTWTYDVDTASSGSGTVTVTADDGNGGTATDSFTWTVTNVAPVLTMEVMPSTTDPCSFAVTVDATDAGRALGADVHFGDGSSGKAMPGQAIAHAYGKAGMYTVTATAEDSDGATASTEKDVSVHNRPSAVLQPINNVAKGAPLSVFKGGSTVPVKIVISDCAGNPVPGLTPTVETKSGSFAEESTADESTYAVTPSMGNAMRYDATSGQYIYNLSTKGLALGDRGITITDTTLAVPVTAWIKLR